MNKNYFLLLLTASAIGGLAFTKMPKNIETCKYEFKKSHLKNVSGAPSGKTGAPGEGNCTACHSGNVIVSDVFLVNSFQLLNSNQQEVFSYIPGQTYTVSINVNSPAFIKGFQSSARILSNNTKAGTSFASLGAQLLSVSGQEYLTHTSSSIDVLPWTYNWTAPSTDVGDIRFYLATNETNSNNSSSGDGIRLSQHTYSANSGAGINNVEEEKSTFSVGFNQSKNALNLDFNCKENASFFLNLVDLNGKSVFSKKLNDVKIGDNSQEIILPKELNSGIYVVNLFENNNGSSKKVYIGK